MNVNEFHEWKKFLFCVLNEYWFFGTVKKRLSVKNPYIGQYMGSHMGSNINLPSPERKMTDPEIKNDDTFCFKIFVFFALNI